MKGTIILFNSYIAVYIICLLLDVFIGGKYHFQHISKLSLSSLSNNNNNNNTIEREEKKSTYRPICSFKHRSAQALLMFDFGVIFFFCSTFRRLFYLVEDPFSFFLLVIACGTAISSVVVVIVIYGLWKNKRPYGRTILP